MSFDPPVNPNYAASIIELPPTYALPGLDNLSGVTVFNSQILVQNESVAGDVYVYFPAGAQISHKYCAANNLYRDNTLNGDETQTGYLEVSRRVRAIKLRGHRSDGMLMPLSSLNVFGDVSYAKVGDTFDTVNGHELCRKYVIPGSEPKPQKNVVKVAKRVDSVLFPEHYSTDNYWRNTHLLNVDAEVVVTQKLHGTSLRVGNVPVRRSKSRMERFINRWIDTPEHEFSMVYGSRKVIKDAAGSQNHFYDTDVWTIAGRKLDGLIPHNYLVYGELIGWTPDGKPLQKNYTYNVPQGGMDLYVYRVAFINDEGFVCDLSWDAVREFCAHRGLKHVPELARLVGASHALVDTFMDVRYTDVGMLFRDAPIPLSHPKTVDEGVCLRQEGVKPTILKAKAPEFIQHEDKLTELDVESAA